MAPQMVLIRLPKRDKSRGYNGLFACVAVALDALAKI
jgi:hypothetical protein